MSWCPPFGRSTKPARLQFTPASDPAPLPWLILRRRVPKRQQPVKIELFDGLQESERLQLPCHRPEAQGFEQRRRAEMDEGQLVEARRQPPVADRRLRVDVVRLGKPFDRLALLADLVGELELDRLASGEHPAVA